MRAQAVLVMAWVGLLSGGREVARAEPPQATTVGATRERATPSVDAFRNERLGHRLKKALEQLDQGCRFSDSIRKVQLDVDLVPLNDGAYSARSWKGETTPEQLFNFIFPTTKLGAYAPANHDRKLVGARIQKIASESVRRALAMPNHRVYRHDCRTLLSARLQGGLQLDAVVASADASGMLQGKITSTQSLTLVQADLVSPWAMLLHPSAPNSHKLLAYARIWQHYLSRPGLVGSPQYLLSQFSGATLVRAMKQSAEVGGQVSANAEVDAWLFELQGSVKIAGMDNSSLTDLSVATYVRTDQAPGWIPLPTPAEIAAFAHDSAPVELRSNLGYLPQHGTYPHSVVVEGLPVEMCAKEKYERTFATGDGKLQLDLLAVTPTIERNVDHCTFDLVAEAKNPDDPLFKKSRYDLVYELRQQTPIKTQAGDIPFAIGVQTAIDTSVDLKLALSRPKPATGELSGSTLTWRATTALAVDLKSRADLSRRLEYAVSSNTCGVDNGALVVDSPATWDGDTRTAEVAVGYRIPADHAVNVGDGPDCQIELTMHLTLKSTGAAGTTISKTASLNVRWPTIADR